MQYAAVQAAPSQIIKLSCDGTSLVTGPEGDELDKDPTKQGIVIDLTDGTVSGDWGSGVWGVVARITSTNGHDIKFSGQSADGTNSVRGEIDRQTGLANVYTTLVPGDKIETVHSTDELTCKPTNREF
jgi:hypothetical protein